MKQGIIKQQNIIPRCFIICMIYLNNIGNNFISNSNNKKQNKITNKTHYIPRYKKLIHMMLTIVNIRKKIIYNFLCKIN